MANTRIVLLIPTLDRSGAEKQFTLLATQLPKDEFDVHAVILTRGGPYEVDLSSSSIPVTIIGKRSKFDPTAFWRLRRELKRLDPDILHTWLFAANAYGRLASSVVPRAKIVVSERCVDTWKAGWQLWLDRRLIESTDRMVGNSQGVVDFYHSMGVPLEKLVCIPNGIELARSSNHRTEATANSTVIQIRKQLHSELGLPDDAFVAGFVGRLAKQKRVEDLIWAVETLRQIRPQLHLVLIGDGPERERLKRFANDIHCTDHIRFLGHLDDATRYFPAFDVFCLASSFEGMSNSVMEAMVAGLPVIASDIPPNREIVMQSETGFLFKLADTVGIMQFLRRLIDEPGMRERMGLAGQVRMRTHFSVELMVQNYSNLYRELMRH